MHASITAERVAEALERFYRATDNPGFCLACGEEADCCEPDATGYPCEACGAEVVAGAETVYLGLIEQAPGALDTSSSASRQHYIDTGRYLPTPPAE